MTLHYDDETLFQYVEGTSEIQTEIASHVAACATCRREVASQQEFISVLKAEPAWTRSSEPAVTLERIAEIASFADQIHFEQSEAARLCDSILTGPAAWWRTKLMKTDGAQSAGLVRELISRADDLLDTAPANALEVAKLAIEIAEELYVAAYASETVITLRAQALRQYAFVLSYLGRYPEALKTIDRAEALFRQTPHPDFELARVGLVRANILIALDREADAIALTRRSAETFLHFGERTRYVNARITEGAMMLQSGSAREALAIWHSVEADAGVGDELNRVRLQHNIGICYRDLGTPVKAIEYLQAAAAGFELLGIETEAVRSRWALATALIATPRASEAVPLFRKTWKAFEELQMEGDAALVALELAELLLVLDQPEEVPAICRTLLDRFTRAGMTSRAITALAFLREAVAIGQANPVLVRHVHDFLRELPAQSSRASALRATSFID